MRTANAPDQFDTTRAIERLGKILDGTPHPVDSAPLDAVRSRLLQEIVTLGYQPQIKATSTCRGSISGSSIRCALVQNIYFTAGPKTGPALILTAHYDSVPASPGRRGEEQWRPSRKRNRIHHGAYLLHGAASGVTHGYQPVGNGLG